MTRYVEILDKENPKEPKGENIAEELDKGIAEIETESKKKFVTFTFLEQKDVPMEGEDSLMSYCVGHDKVQQYMLYFR